MGAPLQGPLQLVETEPLGALLQGPPQLVETELLGPLLQGPPQLVETEPLGALSRETGISGNFAGRIKGAKCPFDLQFLTWDFS